MKTLIAVMLFTTFLFVGAIKAVDAITPQLHAHTHALDQY